ncbi:MAG: IS5 family transposase, partial [Nitrosospira sp.]
MRKTTETNQQMSFSEAEYRTKKKLTRRDIFLSGMEQVVPWSRLIAIVEPHYPKSGKRGRPPIGIERMLRMYFIQQWYGLADVAVEDAIYDRQALRRFCGIDLAVASVPDSTTLMDFRHLLEKNALAQAMLQEVNALLKERGLLMSQGTLIDSTLIAAPSSTKNKPRTRDPEMHQAKKGNQWHFGMKAHIGVDAQSGLVHTIVSTAPHVSDVSQTANLMHGEETCVGADAGYVGAAKREEVRTKLQGKAHELKWRIAKRRKPIKQMPECWQKDLALAY